ncbi:alpha/beta fold hydrolase [Antribacter gilvus]|uniref:alpha/beta fold hydrolase n=1 Tax=Antribacter gilvus TaxID=2304675 RepID=UPI000F779DA1|nr:alpha/beta hydrolase [Antribacter gilvus]
MSYHVTEHHPENDETVLFLHGGVVGGWMWAENAEALTGHHSLAPDLPGFAGSAHLPWVDLATTTDVLADLVRDRAHGGRAHVVGLSFGAVVGTTLAARHPDIVRSVLATGAMLRGAHGFNRWIGLAQLPLWGSPAYWKVNARIYGIPEDGVDQFVATGLGLNRDSARRMVPEIFDGVPADVLDGLRTLDAPMLALAGEKEPRFIRDAQVEAVSRAPRAVARLAPGMHHVWSLEDPALFQRTLDHWLATGEPSPELLPVPPAGRVRSA